MLVSVNSGERLAVQKFSLSVVVLDQLGDWLLKGMKELSNLFDDILFFLGVRYHLVNLGAEQQALARYVTVCRRLAKWHLIKGSISITLSAANCDDSESNRGEDEGQGASSSSITTTSTTRTPSCPANKGRRRSFRLELPSGVLSELAYTREGEQRPSALYLVPNRDELFIDKSLAGGPSSTPNSRHSEDGEGEEEGGEADIQWDYKCRRDPPVLAALMVTSTWMASCAALFCLWEEWDYFTSIYFFFVSMSAVFSTIGFGDVTPKYPQYMMGAFSLVLVGLSLVSVCINVAQEKFSLIYMDLLEETLQQYVRARERGDVDAVKTFVSGFNTSKAKFLMPLISRNENMKIMTQFKQAAEAQGVELPTSLMELNPDTGKPAFCKIFEEHEMDEFVKNAELELKSKVEKPKLKNTSTQTRGEMPMRKGHTFFISRAEQPSQQSFEVAQTDEASSPFRCTLLESTTQTERIEVISTDLGVQCCPSTEEEGTQFDRWYGVVDTGTFAAGTTRITKSTGVQPDVSCILRQGAYDESYDGEERVDSDDYLLCGLVSEEGEVTDASLGVGAKRSLQMRRSARFESSLDELPTSSGTEEEPQRRAVSLAMHLEAAAKQAKKLGEQRVGATRQLGASETSMKEGGEEVVGKRRMRGKKSVKQIAGLRYMRNVGVQVMPQSAEASNQIGCPWSALSDVACSVERVELIEESSQTQVLTRRCMETQWTPLPRSIVETETQTAWVVEDTSIQTEPVKGECQITQTDCNGGVVETAMQTDPFLPVVECRLTQTDNHVEGVDEEVQTTSFMMEEESPPESAYETPPSELQSQLLQQSCGRGSWSDKAVQVDIRTEMANRLVQTQLTSTFQRRGELSGGPTRTKSRRKKVAQHKKVQDEEEEEELPTQPTFQMRIDSVQPVIPGDCSLNITLTMPQPVGYASYQPRDELTPHTPMGGCHLVVKEPNTESRAPVDHDSCMKEPSIALARTEDENWETETEGDSERFEEVADFTFDAQTQTANPAISDWPQPSDPDHDDKWTQTESEVTIIIEPQDTAAQREEASEEIESSAPESVLDDPFLIPELPTIRPPPVGTGVGRGLSMPVGLELPGKQKETGQQAPRTMLRRQSNVHPQTAQPLRRPSIPIIKLKGKKISRLVTKFEAIQSSVAAEGESSNQMLPMQDEERSPKIGVEQWFERGRELDERLGKWAKQRKSMRGVRRVERVGRRRRPGKVVLKLAVEAVQQAQKQLPEIVEVALAMLPESVRSALAEQITDHESTSARLLYHPGFDLYVHEASGVQMKMQEGMLVQVDEPVNLELVMDPEGESIIGAIVEDAEGELHFVPHQEGSTSALAGGVVRGKLVGSAAGVQLIPAAEADEHLLEKLNRMIAEGSIQLPQVPHELDSSGDEEEEWRELEEFFEIYRKLVEERPEDVFRLLEFARLDRLEKLAALHSALLTGEYSASRLRELYPIIRERLLRALRSKQSLDRERSDEERRQLESIQQRVARSDRMVSMGVQAGLLTRVMHLFEDEELESELAEIEELRSGMVVSMPEKARHVITLTQELVLSNSEGEDTIYH